MNIKKLEAAFKSRLSLDLENLDELSRYLTQRWKMFCFAETTEAFREFADKNTRALRAFESILNENEAKKDSASSYSPKNQRALYDKLSRPPFGPWTMGARWPQVLSSLAAIDKLVSITKPANVLEIGCGTGFAYDWLRSKYALSYTGIDFSPGAIESAKRLIKPGPNASFQVVDANTFESDGKYDLIFSIAGLPRNLDANLIDRFARHLGNTGLIYVQISGPPGPASKWEVKPSLVNLVFEDSTGGLEFSGGGYCHTSNFVFATDNVSIRKHIYEGSTSWSEFATCMNSGAIHERERNFGYFNANGRPNTAWPFQHGKWDKI